MSTTDQGLERQIDALRKHRIPNERIYVGKNTGSTVDWPGSPRRATTPTKTTPSPLPTSIDWALTRANTSTPSKSPQYSA
ncbi:hypothetical protein [Amycolatopsis sp. cmx-11-12]|uniref:hypothetical protein n=1 Tax=Amycolatopsis sp. cmx-11-12 TaxID=2785795 RepID=UPI0039180F73